MNEHKFAFVEPGRERRKRKERLKATLREPVGEARAKALALLARELHQHRELNLAMDAARHCIEGSRQGSAYLVDAYLCHERTDHAIEDLAMLADLGRWLEHSGLTNIVRTMAYEQGKEWCGCTDGRERERRIDTLRRRFDDRLANKIDLALL